MCNAESLASSKVRGRGGAVRVSGPWRARRGLPGCSAVRLVLIGSVTIVLGVVLAAALFGAFERTAAQFLAVGSLFAIHMGLRLPRFVRRPHSKPTTIAPIEKPPMTESMRNGMESPLDRHLG